MTAHDPRPVPPAPPWAVCCAWLVPLLIAPSAIWRTSLVVTDPAGFPAAVASGGWYLLLLGVVSLGLGLLTVGLVRPWGSAVPRRVPVLGGRELPVRWVTGAAMGGGITLVLLTVWFLVSATLHPFDVPETLSTGGPPHPRPGWSILRWYLPLAAWGPLVIAVARDHHRRRTGRPASKPAGGGAVDTTTGRPA